MSLGRALPWILRAAWAVLPLVSGPAFADALQDRSRPVQVVGSVGSWAVWAGVLSASLILHPVTLTIVRAAAPAALLAAIVAAFVDASFGRALLAVIAGLVVTFLAMLPETAVAYVNGPAYPNERRLPLRAPGPLLVGPLELSWALCVVAPAAGALLLAAKQWVLGLVALAVGAVSIAILGRSMYSLARRWIVFVPAGVVLHDPMTLADPMLFRRKDVSSFDLAPADTHATDLTARAFGLAIELATTEPVKLATLEPGSRTPTMTSTSRLLFTPTRPGAVLAEARERRLD